MPELPEVETIKNELLPYVAGKKITGVDLFWEKMLRQPSFDEFQVRIKGQKINGILRRGKYLVFKLESGDWLLIHLRMSGALLAGRGLSPRFTRAVFHLDDGSDIYFCDPRKFGRIQLVRDKNSVLGKLGVEPMEKAFTAEVLGKLLGKRKAPVKAVLLEQGLIAGIGNMYADEALFDAAINPLRAAESLSDGEIQRLHRAIRTVLKIAIESKGASISNYYRPSGEKGSAHNHFRVAHHRGEECPVCATPLERITIRQRGSYYCPKCQK
ncbi:bifunctional DNA-formamidopyrimidine glycosylase/DNA-(apurinic or apyrimidinic site) lyase [Chloroflexota bacterium]